MEYIPNSFISDNQDTDRLILCNLDGKDLLNVTSINKTIQENTCNQIFWINKYDQKFGIKPNNLSNLRRNYLRYVSCKTDRDVLKTSIILQDESIFETYVQITGLGNDHSLLICRGIPKMLEIYFEAYHDLKFNQEHIRGLIKHGKLDIIKCIFEKYRHHRLNDKDNYNYITWSIYYDNLKLVDYFKNFHNNSLINIRKVNNKFIIDNAHYLTYIQNLMNHSINNNQGRVVDKLLLRFSHDTFLFHVSINIDNFHIIKRLIAYDFTISIHYINYTNDEIINVVSNNDLIKLAEGCIIHVMRTIDEYTTDRIKILRNKVNNPLDHIEEWLAQMKYRPPRYIKLSHLCSFYHVNFSDTFLKTLPYINFEDILKILKEYLHLCGNYELISNIITLNKKENVIKLLELLISIKSQDIRMSRLIEYIHDLLHH